MPLSKKSLHDRQSMDHSEMLLVIFIAVSQVYRFFVNMGLRICSRYPNSIQTMTNRFSKIVLYSCTYQIEYIDSFLTSILSTLETSS